MDNSRNPDEDRIFEALRASDPAAGAAEPDLTFLRARVLAKAAAETAPRGRTWSWAAARLLPACAAACALAIGAGTVGYALGNAPQDNTVSASGPGSRPTGPQEATTGQGGEANTAPGLGAPDLQPGKAAEMAPSMILPGGWRVHYRQAWAEEPASPDVAEAYTYMPLDPQRTREALADLGKALELQGEVRQTEYGEWKLATEDGSKSLTLSGYDPTGYFYYYDNTPWQPCAIAEPAPDQGTATPLPRKDNPTRDSEGNTAGSSGSGTVSEPATGQCENTVPVRTATTEGALASSKALLTAIGLSPEDYDWYTETYETVWVSATPRTGDTDARWTFTFYSNEQPVGMEGRIGTSTTLGEYPIITPSEAVERLNDPRFGAMWNSPHFWPTPQLAEAGVPAARQGQGAAVSGTSGTSEPAPSPPPVRAAEPGEDITWTVQTIDVVGASLGLVQHYQDGATMLVPAYLLKTSDGGEIRVLAVADSALEMTGE